MHTQKEHSKEIFRKAGLKITSSRLALLSVLKKAGKPMSAQEIITTLGKRKYDQVTIYRILQKLKETGILKQIDFQHGVAYYELTSLGEHHHAICINCSRVEDIEDCCAEGMDAIALKQSGFAEITQHSLEFFGLCQSCKA